MIGVRARTLAIVIFVVLCPGWAGIAHAQNSDEELTEKAKVAFKEGAQLVEQAEWARALTAFEQSRSAREHALTQYNIGVCQRFLGHYNRARESLAAALARNEGSQEMPAMFADQAKTYVGEIEQKLVRVRVSLRPATAAIAVEGRPLTASSDGSGKWIAGLAPAGAGKSIGTESFEVLVDPGTAVFTFSLEGHETIEVRRDLKPGSAAEVPVSMTEQPASVNVSADRPSAIVRLDDVDIGMAPVIISRPPGTYRLSVMKQGYVASESKLVLRPGQNVRIDAKLSPEPVPVTKRWWFWTVGAAVLAGVGVTTYLLVRPEPTRPEVERGGLNWAAEVR